MKWGSENTPVAHSHVTNGTGGETALVAPCGCEPVMFRSSAHNWFDEDPSHRMHDQEVQCPLGANGMCELSLGPMAGSPDSIFETSA